DAVLCALTQARTPGHFCAATDLDPKLDKPLQAAFGKASSFVTTARNASARKQVRVLRKARAQLDKVRRRAGGKKAGKTTTECKTAIIEETGSLATDVAGLADLSAGGCHEHRDDELHRLAPQDPRAPQPPLRLDSLERLHLQGRRRGHLH